MLPPLPLRQILECKGLVAAVDRDTSLGCASSVQKSSLDGHKESPVSLGWAGRDISIPEPRRAPL